MVIPDSEESLIPLCIVAVILVVVALSLKANEEQKCRDMDLTPVRISRSVVCVKNTSDIVMP